MPAPKPSCPFRVAVCLLVYGIWLFGIAASVQAGVDSSAQVSNSALTNAPELLLDQSQIETQNWMLHGQNTDIVQAQPGFTSPYVGPHSLQPGDNVRQTVSVDLFTGAHLWPGGEVYFNPEYFQGYGFGNTTGLAAYPSGEAYKVGSLDGNVIIPHLFYRQTFGFGGEQEQLGSDQLQLAEKVDISRLTFTVGRIGVSDQFDNNTYAHDQRTQFMNWALIDGGAFDYAADAFGYTEGATLEFNQKNWAIRGGTFMVPKDSNGLATDQNLTKAWEEILELEERYKIADHPGKLRLLAWLQSARMGSYSDTLDNPALDENIVLTENYRKEYGFELNAEQEIVPDIGAFSRLSWRDGHSEVWEFTDIDRSLSAGFQFGGNLWGRKNDTVGLAGIVDMLSSVHKDYLAAGGVGPLIGDGQLTNYQPEGVMETYYDAEIIEHVHLALDYQFFNNPAYNGDRGPVNVFSARLHMEF